MPKIHCTKKMDALLVKLGEWTREHRELDVDLHKECEDLWGPNYALVEYSIEAVSHDEYTDIAAALDDFRKMVRETLGQKFQYINGAGGPKKEGQLYCHFWGRELEIYRYKKRG